MIQQRKHISRISEDNQVPIPAEILDDLGLKPGDEVEVVEEDGKVSVCKSESWLERLQALQLRLDLPALSDEEIAKLVSEARVRSQREMEPAKDSIRRALGFLAADNLPPLSDEELEAAIDNAWEDAAAEGDASGLDGA